MLFNSFDFLIFFPTVVVIYLFIPRSLRAVWLLVASYFFYMSWNPKYAALIGISTVITFLSGIFIERMDTTAKKKLVVAVSLISNLGILGVFKYANFTLDTLGMAFGRFGTGFPDWHVDLLLPVGISFYTFQALGYTLDVYRGKIGAEKNLLSYALFVSFFPQLVAGPIERSGNLLRQIRRVRELDLFDFVRIRDGLLLMFWGLFQKLVISDRASILVHQVYDNYKEFGFAELAVASVLFAFQIYCDFGGYTNIARGAAKVMGFSLMDNFRQPYLATDIREFWRRWHISLTSWFTDYLYIPLGGNRKGLGRKYLNVLVVFGVSGLWHGASWHFVAWGLIHAVFQIVGDLKRRAAKKLSGKDGKAMKLWRRIIQVIITFILVDFAWVFFASDSMSMTFGIFGQMLTTLKTASLFEIGLDGTNWAILIVSLVVLLIVDLFHEKGKNIAEGLGQRRGWIRIVVFLILVWAIIMFGIYGVGYDTSQFIYFQF